MNAAFEGTIAALGVTSAARTHTPLPLVASVAVSLLVASASSMSSISTRIRNAPGGYTATVWMRLTMVLQWLKMGYRNSKEMTAMQSERLFEQAVQLAAAFVANGDIRLAGSTRPSSQAQAMLADLIPALYETLERARDQVAASDPSRPRS